MVKALVIGSILWPMLLASAAWARIQQSPSGWPNLVYLAASRVCHQRPERSFHTAGVKWPVCGRCSGLYLAAPAGALLGAAVLARRRYSPLRLIVIAAIPTAITVALEWPHLADVTNLERFVAALPLGAAIAYVLVRTAAGPREPIE
jgi:uncharacterized membrane protein